MLLNLGAEKDINWVELSCRGWNGWSADKLQKRWAVLKVKAKVDARATHRGEFKDYFACGTLLMISSRHRRPVDGPLGTRPRKSLIMITSLSVHHKYRQYYIRIHFASLRLFVARLRFYEGSCLLYELLAPIHTSLVLPVLTDSSSSAQDSWASKSSLIPARNPSQAAATCC